MARAAFSKQKVVSLSISDSDLRKKLGECYPWSIVLHDAEAWTLRKVDQKYLESFEIWCWRGMEKISWTDHLSNEEALQRVKERNILRTIKSRKSNWIGHILRRNCLQNHVADGNIEGMIEVT